ncbi:hypothetical protein [Sedimentitalea todarodis]|uniref:Uncharacterized protein n=1 Tax=Sedimentitalea todarodis TaxID=1631240 RepID=A0ABU3V8K9_9RHOB|nr:hypothetical protein [Sedimentitalea todarodis]MDU9002508.1 hypothetical protein [Sedimentitalea todarodis]
MTRGGPDSELSDKMQPSMILERQNYRRRRLMDAARILPLLGALLFALPLLWPASGPEGDLGDDGVAMSSAIIYVFSVWSALIVSILVFGKSTQAWSRPSDDQG